MMDQPEKSNKELIAQMLRDQEERANRGRQLLPNSKGAQRNRDSRDNHITRPGQEATFNTLPYFSANKKGSGVDPTGYDVQLTGNRPKRPGSGLDEFGVNNDSQTEENS